jgi:hypothetical protein
VFLYIFHTLVVQTEHLFLFTGKKLKSPGHLLTRVHHEQLPSIIDPTEIFPPPTCPQSATRKNTSCFQNYVFCYEGLMMGKDQTPGTTMYNYTTKVHSKDSTTVVHIV